MLNKLYIKKEKILQQINKINACVKKKSKRVTEKEIASKKWSSDLFGK